jgi:hypothetical protein
LKSLGLEALEKNVKNPLTKRLICDIIQIQREGKLFKDTRSQVQSDDRNCTPFSHQTGTVWIWEGYPTENHEVLAKSLLGKI